jgi:hypothetical protein
MNKNSRKRGLDSSDQPKLLTSVAVVKRSQPVSDRYDPEETNKQQEHFSYSKPALQEVHKIPDVAQRNKRLFGNLISHLGKAKSNFETDTIVEQQNKLKDEVTKKNTEESLRISLLRKKKVMEERNQERKLRTVAILRYKLNYTTKIKINKKSTIIIYPIYLIIRYIHFIEIKKEKYQID